MLDRINLHRDGLLLMLVSALMVYGARIIVERIFSFSKEQSDRPIIVMKLVGLLIGILGMLRIFEII